MTAYVITAVRGPFIVELRRGSVVSAVCTIQRLRQLGWSVGVSSNSEAGT
jgi:hypothetical protein